MPGKPTMRKVTAMMMDFHQHVELVEINTHVIMGATIDNVTFACVTADVEAAANTLLDRNGKMSGDYQMVGILVACLYGPLAGRIVWATGCRNGHDNQDGRPDAETVTTTRMVA